MNTLKTFFTSLGLNEKEEQVFFALAKLGSSGVIEISKNTGFSRSTTYYLLDQLELKGLASHVQVGNRRTYTPSSIQRIEKILEEKKEATDNQIFAFKHLLPDISLLYGNAKNKPKFTYYEGQRGAQEIFDSMLINNKEIMVVGEVETFEAALGEQYMEKFVEKRRKLGIWVRGIWVEKKNVTEYPASEEHLRNIRYAPEWFSAPVAFYIFKDKVAFISSVEESFAAVIESKDFTTTLRSWFELLWLGSESKGNKK